MNKQFLRFSVLIFISVSIFISCKKTHPLHAYPDNMRINNFTRVTTTSTSSSILNETFSFSYDGYNRVQKIIHVKNDGSSNLVSTLTYSNDSIFDTTRYVNLATIIEIDTFITDQKGLISVTHEPAGATSYDYIGKLVSRRTFSNGDNYLYTSYNANLLKATYSADPAKNIDYTYYTDKFNRPGDYLQITSFLKYGYNFYQNDNLIWHTVSPYQTTTVDYVIDADNKITRTTAVIADTAGALKTEVYDFQYEQYK